MAARAFVGTSGWNYKDWRERFYPKGVPQSRWLQYLSTQLETVEINGSFYKIPTEKSVAAWQDLVPSHFRFAVKMWRGITHYRKLNNCEQFLTNYFQVVDTLAAPHRAPLLIQLPANQHKDLDKLDRFLHQVKELSAHRWKLAVEFRHDSWLDDDTTRLLNRQRAALCLHDMQGKAAVDQPNKASFVYIRRHGPGKKSYHGSYPDSTLQHDARRIRAWLREGRTVYCYFNNDVEAHAPQNALRLKQLLDR